MQSQSRRIPAVWFLFFSVLSTAVASGGGLPSWWVPGKYNGVIVFDRWGACYLYSGASVLAVSEKVKDSVREYAGKAVLVDVQGITQFMSPGDGLITKLKVLGPSEEITKPGMMGPPPTEGLHLSVAPDFSAAGNQLVIQLRNDANIPARINMRSLAPTIFAKKTHPMSGCMMSAADGPSFAAVTRQNLSFLYEHQPMRSSCGSGSKEQTLELSLETGTAISPEIRLDPGESVEFALPFRFSAGEYEFMAGYGVDGHQARTLTSNQFGFNVDGAGKVTVIGLGIPQIARAPRKAQSLCGKVTREDGAPVAKAQVILWPYPYPEGKAVASNAAMTDSDGAFQMQQVPQGKYVMAANLRDSQGVLIGAFGGRRAIDAAPLVLSGENQGCSYVFVIARQPGYTVRGKTTPAVDSATPRTVRMIMTRGDAYPFQDTAVIHPDGRYEFRNLPAGSYQFFAGWTGSGFDVTGDIDEVEVDIHWPSAENGSGVVQSTFVDGHVEQRTLPQWEANEVRAESAFRDLQRALITYAKNYKTGFPCSLDLLGPAPEWFHPTAEHAGLAFGGYSQLLQERDQKEFTYQGYRFTYAPGTVESNGAIKSYTLGARPLQFGKTGTRSVNLRACRRIALKR